MNNNLQKSVRLKEKELRYAFHYQMELARGEKYEEFMNVKRKCELRWQKIMKTLKDNNYRALKQLKASFEAEFIQNLTELEYQHDMEIRNRSNAIIDLPITDNREESDRLLYMQLSEINDNSSKKETELFIFKHRLKRVLRNYINYINSILSKFNPDILNKQLIQANLLIASVDDKIKTKASQDFINERINTCVNTKFGIKPKFSSTL